jgi:excinuclease ABC subunit A
LWPQVEQSGGLFDRARAQHDVIKTADWVLDLRPEGGVKGGEIVAQGTPEVVAKAKGSFTGKYLAPLLKPKIY